MFEIVDDRDDDHDHDDDNNDKGRRSMGIILAHLVSLAA